mgnify:FL=1
MYAESMELFSLIIHQAAELAKLARTLVADGMRFIALLARSRIAMAAENFAVWIHTRRQFHVQPEGLPRRKKSDRTDNTARRRD